MHENKLTKQAFAELKEYFQGQRTALSFQLKQTGADFQQNVWAELRNIKFWQNFIILKAIRAIKKHFSC